jgi:hypothetical protein
MLTLLRSTQVAVFVLALGQRQAPRRSPYSAIQHHRIIGAKQQRQKKVRASMPWRKLSLFAASYIESAGNVIAKETKHFPSRVRASRIGIGSGGTATRPSMTSSMDAPLL